MEKNKWELNKIVRASTAFNVVEDELPNSQ